MTSIAKQGENASIVAGAVGIVFAEQRAHQPQDNSLRRCETHFNTLLSAECDCCASELQMQIRWAAKQHREKTQRRLELSEEQSAESGFKRAGLFPGTFLYL